MGESGGSDIRNAVTCSFSKRYKLGEDADQLLPGIPDNITVDGICTKLPWKAFRILSSVSPSWRKAIISHRIYDARLRSRSAEKLLLHSHPFEVDFSCEQLYLYSAREKRCYELPQIKGVNRGIPWECRCIQLDGKIYVLGGGTGYGEACYGEDWYGEDDEHRKSEVFKEVYMLDLVAPVKRKWKRCASMQEGRLKFGCGVMGGKIYVFGGASHYGPVRGCEVYDPNADAWAPIRPMKSWRFDHQVASFGDTFLVFDGEVFDPDYAGGRGSENRFLDCFDGSRVPNESVRAAVIMEAYHPVKDEWREVEPCRKHDSETIFMADGKFYLITQVGIYVQDTDTNSWKPLYSNLFPRTFPAYCKVELEGSVVVGDALFVNVSRGRNCLLRGEGFGTDNLKIVWNEVDCEDQEQYGCVKCLIQL